MSAGAVELAVPRARQTVQEGGVGGDHRRGQCLREARLFPGGRPGRPINAWAMGERLRKPGVRLAQARSTALFQLATELPAAVLARTLGIDITVGVTWQRAAAGDWAPYAADVANRRPQPPRSEGP